MNIDNLVRLTKGELLSKPKISSIANFATILKDVTLGSCFFTSDENEARKALNLGAYAIISDDVLDVLDSDIAYIKVDILKRAKFRIIRYFTALNDLKFIKVTPLMAEILEFMKFDKSVFVLDDKNIFNGSINAPKKSIIFSQNISGDITQNFIALKPDFSSKFEKNSSIFHMKFSCKNSYFSTNLPEIFTPEIYALVNFLRDVEFKFRDFSDFKHFNPIFVDKFYNIKSFGESYRAFIAESDEKLFIRATNYLKSKFSRDILTFSPITSSAESDIKFDNLDEIKTKLNFRYALVLANKDEILDILNLKKDENLLF